jgi:LmbE family N-acetylglucosaminyl deacetylase
MAVHAHPDDESISTGGILARYGAEGVRTVLVTCTDGGCGDGAEGSKPGHEAHDRESVVKARAEELARSAEVLGVAHLENLGYADSGMMGWPENDEPGSFWRTPVAEAAGRLAELFRRYQPQVVVTYDPNGFYGHPDHIQAHRITVEAARLTGIPVKVYYTAVPRSRMADFGRRLQELGITFDDDGSGGPADGGAEDQPSGPREEWGTPDEEVTTYVDVAAYADSKFDSLHCHESQSDNIFFLKMGRDVFRELMGIEAFVRASDRSGAPVPEDDLFAGLR